MRRKDREVTDLNRIAEIMQRCQAVSIAFGGEEPYVIPMNYGFEFVDGRFTLYVHGAGAGEKINRIKADPRAAFTMFTGNEIYGGEEAHSFTSSFDSVCGSGTFRFLEGEDKVKGLTALMAHYVPGRAFTFDERMLKVTTVMALDVQQITGKHHD